ncbi:hypothetical protein [Nocardioides sp. AE5]|uniref:hypothetical protein n=1 Tax=Nocardioides sp. AE5 TaxID=2962573 RepID=UPI00288102B1|nr:hypothetical protein [Nocardioides sp. AE5]MDT0201429.1 hypothetical protein [Nocardioides sp. AE5]
MNEKQTPRRVAGSRNPVSAPRRIAGRRERSGTPEAAPVEETAPTEESTAYVEEAPATPEAAPATTESRPGLLGRGSTTRVLAVLLSVLAVANLVMLGLAAWHHWGSDDSSATGQVISFDDPYEVREVPVQLTVAEWNAANKAAQDAVTEMFTFTWQDYDENVAAARDLITEGFRAEYDQTTRATRERVMSAKAEYAVEVVGRSVIEARGDEVATLLFINQTVTKGAGEEKSAPEQYQSRVRVKMVRTDDGWLLDELAPQ